MKKIARIIGAFLLSAAVVLPASSQTMVITTNSGDTHTFPTVDIKQVSFDGFRSSEAYQINISDISMTSVHIQIVPADISQPYYFDVCTKADYERLNGNIASIVENYMRAMQSAYPELDVATLVSAISSVNTDEDVVSGLPADTEMVCYVIGVNYEGKAVGEPAIKEFRTLPGGAPEDCTFDISYSGLGASQLTVIVQPSDPSVRYWMGVYPVFDYPGDEAMKMLVKNTLLEYCAENKSDLADVVKGVTFAGNIQIEESGLEAAKSYYIYVYAMNESGDGAGPMYKLNFTTALQDYSDAALTLAYRYFDGTAMANLYPDKFSNARGGVLLQPVFAPNDETENYVWALAAGDYTDLNTYPDDATRKAVMSNGFINVPSKNIYARYGDATFLYFGSDIWGVDGKLFRTLVHITKEGVSDPSEYYDVTETKAQSPAPVRLRAKRTTDRDVRLWKRFSRLNRLPEPMRNSAL